MKLTVLRLWCSSGPDPFPLLFFTISENIFFVRCAVASGFHKIPKKDTFLIHTLQKIQNARAWTNGTESKIKLSSHSSAAGKIYLKRERGPLAPVWAAWFINMRGYRYIFAIHVYWAKPLQFLFSYSFSFFLRSFLIRFPFASFTPEIHMAASIYLCMLV